MLNTFNGKQTKKMKAKINLSNIKGFLQAHYRQILDEMGFLDKHIYEQWIYRIGIMNEECLINGMCPCECEVPAKQLEDRSCDNHCYRDMLSKEEWEEYKNEVEIEQDFKKAIERIEKYKLIV